MKATTPRPATLSDLERSLYAERRERRLALTIVLQMSTPETRERLAVAMTNCELLEDALGWR